MAKKKLSPRAERRSLERARDKLGRDRERLAYLEPGGDRTRPIAVESASQVEPHALGSTCLRCGGTNRLDEHAAVMPAGHGDSPEILRVAKLLCAQCGARRDMWFRLATRLPN